MAAQRVGCVILGATGLVGQRLVAMLDTHPWLEVEAVAASPRSAGRRYSEACRWRASDPSFAGCGHLRVQTCAPEALEASGVQTRLVLSALDGTVAGPIESAFAAAGWTVVSNASAHRADPRIPLVIPEVNPDHLSLLDRSPWQGGIVTNPNCVAIPVAMVLKALGPLGVQKAFVSTYQAVSGAGYPGESAWDMIGNVRPHPGDEEEKVQQEPAKILGSLGETGVRAAAIAVSARCVRVPVVDGHLVAMGIQTDKQVSAEDASELLAAWSGECAHVLPSSPDRLIALRSERDRPSPRLDAGRDGGLGITVGRVERCSVMGLKLYVLAHNMARGAAAAALLNAELLLSEQRVARR